MFRLARAPYPYRPSINHALYPPPDYYIPGPELRRTTSHTDHKMSLGMRRSRYYPATFSHAPLELRPVKVSPFYQNIFDSIRYFQLKKSFKKVGKTDSVKMYTWSPYTSSMFYTDPKMGGDPATISHITGPELGLQF